MSAPARSALLAIGAALVAGAVIAIAFDVEAALLTVAILLGVAAVALAAAHVLAARRDRLGTLQRQFGFGAALVVGQLVLAVVAIAALMFVSNHDALLVCVIAAFAGVVGIRAAQLFTRGVLADVEAVRDGLVAVGEGARDADISTGSRDEVGELADAANAMIRRLAAEEAARDASDRARRDLIAAVSHDLRTPLTSLRLLAEALDDDLVDEETRRRYVATMGANVRALSALVDDLFELSRLEAGEIEWSLERVRLGDLVGETVSALRPEAEAKGVVMRYDVPDTLAEAQANPEKVQRVLFNLIQNALRHTPADGSVTVRADGRDGRLEIEVADTGEGIAPGDGERVFEPFYRGGSEAARTRGGLGLGLAISRAIVEAHGGRIWLADAGGPGTRVRFSLPRA